MIPWSQFDHLLGNISDKELAERAHTTEGNIRVRRCRKGIKPYIPTLPPVKPPEPIYDPPLRLVLREDGKAIEREIVVPSGERILVKVDNPQSQHVTINGAIYDNDKHRLIAGPAKGGTKAITPETSTTSMKQARYDKAERAARDAIASGTMQPNSFKGWHEIVKNQVSMAAEPGPYSTNAAKFVGSAAGLLRDRREGDKSEGVTLSIDADVARMLIDRISKLRQGDV